VVLIVMKTGIDLAAHTTERKKLAGTAVKGPVLVYASR